MDKVIVTGASGFIGRHLLERLLHENVQIYAVVYKMKAVDNLPDEANKIKWIVGDLLRDPDAIVQLIIQAGGGDADCLFHLAWNGVSASEKNNYEKQLSNITIGMHVISICKAIQCKKLVNLGTVGEYVSLDGLINEKWVPSPADIYGAMKVAVRNLITVQAALDDIDIINTILCSTYGEYRRDDNVISYTIKSLLNRQCPEYGSMEQMWDFLYAGDVAYALYLIGERGIAGKTYSIGSGVYRHLYEYIECIRDLIDPSLPLGIGKLGNKYEKVLNSCVDTFQLQRDTGFKPEYSFEMGIKKTITYFRETM